ncbi:RNA polymerase sigma factor [Micromonospora mirobrigensis]|uniref:RNA polymerase sigma-70 factor, ECF subfamily n=1 Tax=Micromonospora mirobrigensis TaxID=262898 RepID=A0A1C4ZW36_9ACTN|nr:sigma-70 family RNA polymerase sigma factor [Micromonospora mirobrigensis]SCF37165.1 RNA polymerase sigma-70 factor, ECF subfamily [Micromonospora mirobrigensis]
MNVSQLGTDPDILEAFYRAHIEAVQRFVARRFDDPHTAADLTADIFLAAIQSATSYSPSSGTPQAWIFGIARNVVSMEYRRRGRHAAAVARAGGRRVLESDALERARERIDAEREARRLHQRLRDLPPTLRAVLELVAVDQLSLKEAAAALQISPGTARVRLHRARRQLASGATLQAVSALTEEATS